MPLRGYSSKPNKYHMIHIITNHHETLKWLGVQANYLSANTTANYRVYCGTTDILDPATLNSTHETVGMSEKYCFDLLTTVINNHGDKLNSLASLIDTEEGIGEDDIIIFLDPDAFPIERGWNERIKEWLQQVPVLAISREENPEPLLKPDQKPYPHPCFLATTLKFWKENNLSWEIDPAQGASCAGVLLKKWLDENQIQWGKMLRSNCSNLHPLNFGVYGGLIYHHGSGNRPTYDSVDIWSRPELAQKYGVSLDLHFPQLVEFNGEISDLVFRKIEEDTNFIRMYFCGRDRL